MSILVRIVGGIMGKGAKTVAPINRNMSTGSVKLVRRDIDKYPDDLDELNMIGRTKASAPIKPKKSNSIKIKSGK